MLEIIIGGLCVIGFTTTCYFVGLLAEKVRGKSQKDILETTYNGFGWIFTAAALIVLSYLIGLEFIG